MYRKLALLLFCGVCLLAQMTELVMIPEGNLSQERKDLAARLFAKCYKSKGLAVADADAVAMVKNEFLSQTKLPEQPAVAARTLNDCQDLSQQALKKAMDKVCPTLGKKALDERAAIEYPLYSRGDRVKVSYMANPRYASTVEGIFYGCTSGVITVGNVRIRLNDLDGIEGNQREIYKFDPESTAQLRTKFKEELKYKISQSRSEFVEQNKDEYFMNEIASASVFNEKAGYIFLDGAWYSPNDFLREFAPVAREQYVALSQKAAQNELAKQAGLLERVSETIAQRGWVNPEGRRLNPEDVLRKQQQLEQQKAELEAKKAQEDELRKQKAQEAEHKAEEVARVRRYKNRDEMKMDMEELRQQSDEELNHYTNFILCGGVIIFLVVCIACVLSYMKFHKKEDKDNRFKKFFEGKGQVQKDFWSQADADPDNFKYVAYMFPNLKEATAALAKLTYIQATPNGELRCNRDIQFGVYPHLDGAVAFLGGTNFHYAPWREATAVLPELPGAQYFKVSTEPVVNLDMPDIARIAAEGDLKLESLGVEDITDEDGSFARCYKYKTETKDMAMKFLQNFNISEEGIIVQVETTEGVFAKDENGIFIAG